MRSRRDASRVAAFAWNSEMIKLNRRVAALRPSATLAADQRAKEMQDWKPLQQLYGNGLKTLPSPWHGNDDVALISMQPDAHQRTAVISRNFYVTTRCNRSYNSAMPAPELAHMRGCNNCGTGRQ